MQRITRQHLESKVAYLNQLTGSPATLWADHATNPQMNVGHHYISMAYGGYALARIANEQGGESQPLQTGHISARELAGLIEAYCRGYADALRSRGEA